MKRDCLGRPLGRLFCCLISIVVAAGLGFAQAPATTAIHDVVYRADGTPAAGHVVISWPAFTTAEQKSVAAGSLTVELGAGGAFDAALAPNVNATPAGSYYKVVFHLNGAPPSTETWSVPAVAETTISAVRTTVMPASAAVQVASRTYVDSAIAGKAASGANADITSLELGNGAPWLQRDAGDALALAHGPNPQRFNLYNTRSDAANYERFSVFWAGNAAYLRTESAGTGAARPLLLGVGETPALRLEPGEAIATGVLSADAYLDMSGTGTYAITSDPPAFGGTGVGWKLGLWQNVYAVGVANNTIAAKTGQWFSVFNGNPAGDATSSVPDSGAGVSLGADGRVIAKKVNGKCDAASHAGADFGAKMNAALADASCLWVDASNFSAPSYSTAISVTVPNVHVTLPCGGLTYTGTGQAISVTGDGVTLEGCSAMGGNPNYNRGTYVSVTNTATNGLYFRSFGGAVRDVAFVGPASGTGVGVHVVGGNKITLENVQASKFGGDGILIDSTVANANNGVAINLRAALNGGNGITITGSDANAWALIGGDAGGNTGYGIYLHDGGNDVFCGPCHAEGSVSGTNYYIDSGSFSGSLYSEHTGGVVTTDLALGANSAGADVHLMNGYTLSDAGTGNNVHVGAYGNGSAGIGTQGVGHFNYNVEGNTSGAFLPLMRIARYDTNEVWQIGNFYKSASAYSGATITSTKALNFIYNTDNAGYAARIFNNCTGDITACTPSLTFNSDGTMALGTGATFSGAATFNGNIFLNTGTFSVTTAIKSGVSSCAPSSTGFLRFCNTDALKARNNAASGDVNLVAKDTSDVVQVGDTAGVRVGAGSTAILKHLSATATLDFAAFTAPNCAADLTITVTGAADGDTVTLGVPNGSMAAGVTYFAWVSAANTVTVRACAFTGTPNPAAGTFRVDVWKH